MQPKMEHFDAVANVFLKYRTEEVILMATSSGKNYLSVP